MKWVVHLVWTLQDVSFYVQKVQTDTPKGTIRNIFQGKDQQYAVVVTYES